MNSRPRQAVSPDNWDDQDLFDQLADWQKEGKFASLHSSKDNKWTLLIDTDPWHVMRDVSERNDRMGLRYCTGACATPQAAIRAALKDLR
jgi:hypothetical protein